MSGVFTHPNQDVIDRAYIEYLFSITPHIAYVYERIFMLVNSLMLTVVAVCTSTCSSCVDHEKWYSYV